MEYEVVSVKVPRGMFPEGYELIVDFPHRRDIVPSGSIATRTWCSLVARPKLLKPAWNPPTLKKGWLTWDESCGWYWWEKRPEYHAVDSWTYPQSGDVFENEEIGEVMTEFLGCPDCTGFDERECIWEVGE